MKKLLLILLCLPFFGFGQDLFYSMTNGQIMQVNSSGIQEIFYQAPQGAGVYALTVDSINNMIY